MEEDGHDAERANESYEEEEHTEKAFGNRSPVSELVAHQLARHIPPHKKASEQRAQWQQHLRRDRIAEIKNREVHHLHIGQHPTRQRAKHADDTACHRDHERPLAPRQSKLLMEECRAYLVHGDGGGKCRQGEQRIEQDGNDITHTRHRTESLMKHIGQGDEDERWPRVGIYPHRKGSGENHHPGEHRH